MEKYPLSEKNQYHNHKPGRVATISVEAWCDRSLHVWSWLARRVGTINDISVLMISPFIQDLLCGRFEFKNPDGYRITENRIMRSFFCKVRSSCGRKRKLIFFISERSHYLYYTIIIKKNRMSGFEDCNIELHTTNGCITPNAIFVLKE